PRRGSLRRGWRELVVLADRDLPLLLLVAFLATVIAARAAIEIAIRADLWPRALVRATYAGGFVVLGVSCCIALLTHRRRWRRRSALGIGIAAALVLNSLSVTLAFDTFFRDVWTPDAHPDLLRLYRRGESTLAIGVGGK